VRIQSTLSGRSSERSLLRHPNQHYSCYQGTNKFTPAQFWEKENYSIMLLSPNELQMNPLKIFSAVTCDKAGVFFSVVKPPLTVWVAKWLYSHTVQQCRIGNYTDVWRKSRGARELCEREIPTLSGEVSFTFIHLSCLERKMQEATLLPESVQSFKHQSEVRIIKKYILLTSESDNILCISQQCLGRLEEKVLKMLHEHRHLSDP